MGEEEIVDTYNEDREKIGSKRRKDVHLHGDWHKSFHCWVIRKEKDKSFLLFQLRGPDKVVFPNKLDITAAGHYKQGETIREVSRELSEELGISFLLDDLIYLGTRCEVGTTGKILNREFCEVYMLENPRSITSYKLQEKEVTGLVEIQLEDCMKMFSREVDKIAAKGIMLEEHKNREIVKRITRDDFIPRYDNYYLIISIMAERYFEGKKYSAV